MLLAVKISAPDESRAASTGSSPRLRNDVFAHPAALHMPITRLRLAPPAPAVPRRTAPCSRSGARGSACRKPSPPSSARPSPCRCAATGSRCPCTRSLRSRISRALRWTASAICWSSSLFMAPSTFPAAPAPGPACHLPGQFPIHQRHRRAAAGAHAPRRRRAIFAVRRRLARLDLQHASRACATSLSAPLM